MNKRALLKALEVASRNVRAEIAGTAARGGKYAGAMAGEGRAGGYRDALDDVRMFLTCGYPQDHNGYWKDRP